MAQTAKRAPKEGQARRPKPALHSPASDIGQGVILLAEDDDDQVLLIQRAFQQANFLNPLQVVTNGEEAISYLQGEGRYANRAEYPLPALVLLDLDMPRKGGLAVLQWIRQQPELRALRVVVLTCSNNSEDVTRAYQLGVNSYLVKPLDFPNFVEVTRALKGYWLWMSREPEVSRPAASPPKSETGAETSNPRSS
jgi:CheY-like chemotaxis protein